MAIAADLLQSLVPISQFNKGQAAKIFDRLHSERELIVLKNNQPSAIILSPEEYTRLTEIEEDYYLLLEANRRIEENGDNKTVSLDSVMNHLGISKEELLEAEDVDIELHGVLKIIVVSARTDEQVYKEAAKRREKHDLF